MHIIHSKDPRALIEAAEVITRGDILVYPTDTLYGFGVDAENAESIEKLYALKGRERIYEMLIAVADLQMANRYCIIDERAERLASAFLPGPLALVLPRTPGSPTPIGTQSSSIGIRVPNHSFVHELTLKLGRAITSTSVNKNKERPLTTPNDIAAVFGDSVGLIVDDGYHEGPASTIVDLTGPEITVLREGVFPEHALTEVLGRN
jgi:L-threonylcarbamoyladenylate synthase